MKQVSGGKAFIPEAPVKILIPFWGKVGYFFRSRRWAPTKGVLVAQTKVAGHQGWHVQTKYGIWFISDNFLERIL